jgi:hypothetical protein
MRAGENDASSDVAMSCGDGHAVCAFFGKGAAAQNRLLFVSPWQVYGCGKQSILFASQQSS